MQTGLKSDGTCGYNQAAASFYWTFMPDQYKNTYAYGEIGVNAAGGTGGSYIRSDVIDISSFLSGRNDILSKCTPPTPDLGSVNKEPLVPQQNIDLLLPKWTKESKASVALDSIDFNRWQPDTIINPQNLRNVIEDMYPQRGGLNTRNYTKASWNNENNSPFYDKDLCKTTLDPQRYCGPRCDDINGNQSFLTGRPMDRTAVMPGKPPGQPDYPFTGITSQQVVSALADDNGPQFYYGPEFDKGSAPEIPLQVLKNVPTMNSFPFKP